ncbi:cupin domain-containing protein [Shewanella loihica]|uniref:Transcriptional regulator, XRE family with cupin sensor n=1 Tax=Shewanella loihica (strain ATCC BAA-1088 / PV-4) TaxID=323850 RepID=A3QBJ3_SHELP|nr:MULTISPECIES: cupin domain-containing protein [Shewanella]ABO22841.1 transcriptional regulator, XRE family with cupin sensor [Shewanella loihica PV-4]QYJ83370.1 cupin domain-containing protein [Shewanella aegiceratis]QYJ89112.1 cupin domain-containing protein [Shewanella halotolerans]QYJ94737.1 cupin domain-containing protein [Shewanella spartinae]QYJ98585.1 cupin domain-containing protein [Shewanella alkalitolerans]
MDIGANLKAVRKMKGLSQRELAKRAGVTNSTISMIEKNSVSPSVSSLKKVLSGLPMSLVDFFSIEESMPTEQKVVYRSGELLDIGDGNLDYKLIGRDYPNRAMSVMNEVYPPGSDTGEEMLQHEGEEAAMVIEGQLEITIGDEVYVLSEGDSYYFNSELPHRFRNPFDKPCRIVSATTPANF